jgi:hypothetical protein
VDLQNLQENFDSIPFASDPASLAKCESELEIMKKNDQKLSLLFSELEQEVRKSGEKKP